MSVALVLLGLAFQTPAAQSYPVRGECSESGVVLGSAAKDAALQIHFSIAGSSTCYAVTATIDGKAARGYILGRGPDSIEQFESARRETQKAVSRKPVVQSSASPAAAGNPQGKAVEKKTGDSAEQEPSKPRPKVSL